MQSRRRPHHGNLPTAGPRRKISQCRIAGGLSARHQLPHVVYRSGTTWIHIPCRRDRFTATDGPDCNWPTPEPPHRINQIFLEPILFEHAAAQSRIFIVNRTLVEDVVVEDTGARANLRDLDTGAVSTVNCRYLIGCDGARSIVRKAIGAELSVRCDPAGAVDLYPRARADRPSAKRTRRGHRRHQPAPLRHGVRHRWSAGAGWCTIT